MIKISSIKNNDRTSIVKRNALASIVVKGISILVSLALVPITINYLSPELYGVWLTLSSMVLWLNFFDIGFTLGLRNCLAEALALKDYERGRRLVSTTYISMICIFVPIGILLQFIIPFIDWCALLNVEQQYSTDICNTLHLLSIFFCLQMVSNVLTSVIAAFQKVALSTLFPVIANVIALMIIFIMTKTCPPMMLYLALVLAGLPILVIVIASAILYSGRFSTVCPSWKMFDRTAVKSLFSLGGKFFLLQIQFIVLYQTTNVLISNISGPLEVTHYNIAYRYFNVAMMFFAIIIAPLWPAYTDAFAKKEYVWMNNIYAKSMKFLFLTIALIVMMVFFSSFAYQIWLGDAVHVPPVMSIAVALYVITYCWGTFNTNLVNGVGKLQLQLLLAPFSIIVHIIMSYTLGKAMGMEALGVVISMIVVSFVYCIVFTIQIRKVITQTACGIWDK